MAGVPSGAASGAAKAGTGAAKSGDKSELVKSVGEKLKKGSSLAEGFLKDMQFQADLPSFQAMSTASDSRVKTGVATASMAIDALGKLQSSYEKYKQRKEEKANQQQKSEIGMVDKDTSDSEKRAIGMVTSDERLKAIFGDFCPIDCFSRIHSYVFKYKPEVQQAMGNQFGIDNDVHYGVMAQELEQNPFTRSTVHTDPVSGIKTVDTRELTMANTAAIADIMKELQELRAFKEAVVSAIHGGR